jgi:arylsulfatase
LIWCEQRARGAFSEWSNPLTCLRVGKVFNLRMDPYERADAVFDQHYDWTTKNAYLLSYGVMKTAEFLETFVD